MLANYKSKDGRILPLPSVEDGGNFYLEPEPGVRVPLSQYVNDVTLGLRLLASGLDRDELIQEINERIALLSPPELDQFLDQGRFRQMFCRDFADTPPAEVQNFCQELDEQISAKCGTEFEFQDFDLELPADFEL